MENIVLTDDRIEQFRASLVSAEKAPATAEKYLRAAEEFTEFLSGRALTKELAVEYKRSLVESGLAPQSVNASVAALNCLFAWLGRRDCRLKALRVQRQVFCCAEKELTVPEYRRLLDAAQRKKNGRLRLLLETICGTGVRVGELPYITVEAAKAGEATVRSKGKVRKVFLVKDLRKKLLRYAEARGIASGPVFRTRTGKPLDRSNVWREMKALCKDARVSPGKVFPHNLRHLFARAFYAMKKDIVKLADILGHSSVETTRIYVVSSGKEHRRMMEKMRLVI